jgi:hypothetical protein
MVEGELMQVKLFGTKKGRNAFQRELEAEIKQDNSDSEVLVGEAEVEA